MDKLPKDRAGLKQLAYSQQKIYVDWIISAKREETRSSRIEKAISLLEENKKLRD